MAEILVHIINISHIKIVYKINKMIINLMKLLFKMYFTRIAGIPVRQPVLHYRRAGSGLSHPINVNTKW